MSLLAPVKHVLIEEAHAAAAPPLGEGFVAPAHLRELIWRGRPLAATSVRTLASGYPLLDAELPGGGWPTHGLIEIFSDAAGLGMMQLLSPALATEQRMIMLLGFPWLPFPEGWAQLGIDSRRLLCVRAPGQADWLWALERILKSHALGAVLACLPPTGKRLPVAALRRLQLAAAGSDAMTFILGPLQAALQASPAPLRLRVAPVRPAGEGSRQIELHLFKRRGRPLQTPLRLCLPDTVQAKTELLWKRHVVDRAGLPRTPARPDTAALA